MIGGLSAMLGGRRCKVRQTDGSSPDLTVRRASMNEFFCKCNMPDRPCLAEIYGCDGSLAMSGQSVSRSGTATDTFSGDSYADVIGTPWPGQKISINPDWDVSTHVLNFSITDNNNVFDGDDGGNEWANDNDAVLTVTEAGGNPVASGRPYLEGYIKFTAPDGSTITSYQIEIGGVPVGAITDAELQPGVQYLVTDYSEFSPPTPATYTSSPISAMTPMP